MSTATAPPPLAPRPTGYSSSSNIDPLGEHYDAPRGSAAEDSYDAPRRFTPEGDSGNRRESDGERLDEEDLLQEPPPDYTPVPDLYSGEAVLEQGPQRPFQAPPRPPPQNMMQSQFTGHNPYAPQQPYYGSYPQPFYPVNQGPGPSQPPPLPTRPTSTPPPPLPPRNSLDSRTSGGEASEGDKGYHPSETPVPGQPLLRNGMLLVYPKGHSCSKCHLTGYKAFDPSNPCKKCWEKYGKPYTGALQLAPSGSSSTAATHSNITLQKPLPAPRPPPAPRIRPQSMFTPPPQQPMYSPPPQQGMYVPPPQQPMFQPPRILASDALPPPGAIVLRPGDPRLGGRRCWNCFGEGQIYGFLFDSFNCQVCGGTGRVYN